MGQELTNTGNEVGEVDNRAADEWEVPHEKSSCHYFWGVGVIVVFSVLAFFAAYAQKDGSNWENQTLLMLLCLGNVVVFGVRGYYAFRHRQTLFGAVSYPGVDGSVKAERVGLYAFSMIFVWSMLATAIENWKIAMPDLSKLSDVAEGLLLLLISAPVVTYLTHDYGKFREIAKREGMEGKQASLASDLYFLGAFLVVIFSSVTIIVSIVTIIVPFLQITENSCVKSMLLAMSPSWENSTLIAMLGIVNLILFLKRAIYAGNYRLTLFCAEGFREAEKAAKAERVSIYAALVVFLWGTAIAVYNCFHEKTGDLENQSSSELSDMGIGILMLLVFAPTVTYLSSDYGKFRGIIRQQRGVSK